MVKTILVPVVGTGLETPAFAAAVSVARMFTGHLDFLYARPEPVTAGSVYAGAFPGMLEELRNAGDRQHTAVRQAHLEACKREGIPTDIVGAAAGTVTARWHHEIGNVVNCVARYAFTSDLIVVERGNDTLTTQAVEGALFESGRPVLMPGSQLPSFETVAIAWKPTREAARAVSAVLPLLGHAKRVVIISVSENGVVGADDVERLATSLKRHHPNVETMFLESGAMQVSEALLLHAYRVGAGLLVMGAYSRARLRELIFGGVTESVLQACELSVLMAH